MFSNTFAGIAPASCRRSSQHSCSGGACAILAIRVLYPGVTPAEASMVGFLASDQEPREISAVAVLFGGRIACALPPPGLAMPHPGRVWILDWKDAGPPGPEEYDCAIERILRGRGWSASQIRDLRSR
jgi:hypothetical protein